MSKTANRDGRPHRWPPCDGQNETPQRIIADGTDEVGTAELEAYLAHLVHLDVPLAVKIDLIRALHRIMQGFVDRAFGEDPAQLACEAKGDPPIKTNMRSDD